jgi:hypothetical protein
MSLHGTFHVTNLAQFNVSLIKFRLRHFETEHHILTTGTGATARTVIYAGRIGQVEIHCIHQATDAHPVLIAEVVGEDHLGD